MAEQIEQTVPLTQEPADTKPSTKASTLSVIKEYCGYTSCHGLGRAEGAKSRIQRVFWFLLFVGALAMAAMQLSELFEKYKSRPISTTITISNHMSLRFPKVTICNFNPLRKSLLTKEDPELYAELIELNNQEKSENDESPSTVSNGNLTDVEKENKTLTLNEDDEFAPTQTTKRSLKQRRDIDYNPTTETNNGGDDDGDDDDDDISDGVNNKENDDDDNDNDDDDDDDDDDEDDDGFPAQDPSDLLSSFKKDEKMALFLSKISEERGSKLGHQFADSVVRCSYRGVDCGNGGPLLKYWRVIWQSRYGNCFQFNHGDEDARKILKSNKAGPDHGLTLTLFVNQADYMSQFTKKAGYKVLISDQGPMVFPYEEGISVPPGVASSIGIRKISIKREDPFKNNSCFDTRNTDPGNIYTMQYKARYSNMACKESCLAYNQRRYCGCIEYRFPVADNTPECDFLNRTDVKCLGKVLRLFKDNKMNCSTECPPACEEEYYKVTTSTAAWPSKQYEKEISKELDANLDHNVKFSDDYLELQIFFEALNYEIKRKTREKT